MTRTAAAARRQLRARAVPANVEVLRRFFKTGPGEYGEGDVFIGVKVPDARIVCRDCRGMPLAEVRTLLRSRVHEERLLALLILVDAFRTADDGGRRRIYEKRRRYLAGQVRASTASRAAIRSDGCSTKSSVPSKSTSANR